MAKKTSQKTGKTYYYDPVKAKARRERIKEAAIRGGYEPQERRVGMGITEKKTSKTGKTYYYTPWSKLTDAQKAARLEYGRQQREYAKEYRREHGIGRT